MIFWTVVLFIAYSSVYFIVSQRKIRRLRSQLHELNSRMGRKGFVAYHAREKELQ